MDSTDLKSWRLQPISSSSLPETPPSFLKVVLRSTLRHKKLRIPQKLVRKFGHELSDVAAIMVPNGRVWQVRLTKDGKTVWFDDGWQDFVTGNSISIGYFLVFKYEKNSTFQVLIFDMTACEIDYPYSDEESDEQSSEFEDEMESEECVEISKELFASRSLQSLLGKMGMYFSENMEDFSAEESERAIKIARSLKLKDPSFMVIFRKRGKACREVYVPAKFAYRFVNEDVKSIKLRASNGELNLPRSENSVRILWRNGGGFYLTRGWMKFSMHENLKEGDICIFRLVNRNDVLLELSIFRA